MSCNGQSEKSEMRPICYLGLIHPRKCNKLKCSVWDRNTINDTLNRQQMNVVQLNMIEKDSGKMGKDSRYS